MKHVQFADLTPAQNAAIEKWWAEQDAAGEEFEFRDNPRFATKGNAEEEAGYNDYLSGGCCGYVDVELPCDDGTVLLYGFNYGH